MLAGKSLRDVVKVEIIKTIAETPGQLPLPAPRIYRCIWFVAIVWNSEDKSIVTSPAGETGAGQMLGSAEFGQVAPWKLLFAEQLSRFLGVTNNLSNVHTLKDRVESAPCYGDVPAGYIEQRQFYLTEIERVGVAEEDLAPADMTMGGLFAHMEKMSSIRQKFDGQGGLPPAKFWDKVKR